MKENDLIENQKIRDELVSKIEVLDKVGTLLLMPGTEFMNVNQVADYYQVGEKAIQTLYLRHKEELDEDGICSLKQKEFLSLQNEELEKTQSSKGKITLFFKDGQMIDIPNRGLKVFPKRAVLRIGMLLRDSSVAREVRTQLLNIEEKATEEIKIESTDEELVLANNYLQACYSGNVDEIMKANAEYIAYKNRHIKELQDKCDDFFNTNGLKTFRDVAAILHIGRNKLTKFLRDKRIISYDNTYHKHLIPYARYIKAGYFEVKCQYSDKYNPVTQVTNKGVDYIRTLLIREGFYNEQKCA